MAAPPDLSVVLARMEVKLDQIIEKSGDHEARIRKIEESGKNWQVVLTNSLLTALNAALAGTTLIGG